MATIATYNPPDVTYGDTLSRIDFSFSSHHASPLIKVEFLVRGNPVLSSAKSEIIISDATNWVFYIKQQKINITRGKNKVEMQVTCQDGFQKVYTTGYWNIL